MPASAECLRWFREARFGIFIHWGLYSHLAGYWQGQPVRGIGEQIMRFGRIPAEEYKKVADSFDPTAFDARAWVRLVKEAGARYLVITAKHHDGFAMYHSKVSPFNIVDATPFGRDPMRELAEACREAGIRLCFYYSQYQDWTAPDGAFFWDRWPGTAPAEGQDFERYLRGKAMPQIVELLTGYGPIGLMWYDTPGDTSLQDARRLADLVHAVQPDCLVGPRVGHGQGDYVGMGDNMLPGGGQPLPWESPATLNGTWGFKAQDTQWKSPVTLIRLLSHIVSRGGNYLLNLGPDGTGAIPVASAERLQAVGAWLRRNGEAIYGAGPAVLDYSPPFGALTAAGDRLYVHLYEWPSAAFTLWGLEAQVLEAALLDGGQPLAFEQGRDQGMGLPFVRVQLPPAAPDPAVSVLALRLAGPARVDGTLSEYAGAVELPAHKAQVRGDAQALPALLGQPMMTVDGSGVTDRWFRALDSLRWHFRVPEAGKYALLCCTYTENQTSACEDMPWEGGHLMQVRCGAQQADFSVEDHGRAFPWNLFHRQEVTTDTGIVLTLDAPGLHVLVLHLLRAQNTLGLGPRVYRLVLKRIQEADGA